MKSAMALIIAFGLASSATAHPYNRHSAKGVHHQMEGAQASTPPSYGYADYLEQRHAGEGIIPIEDPHLRGILFVIAGLAGPLALLFAAP
jgi:hypothetical protein